MSGVPAAAALVQELRALLPGMMKTTDGSAPSGGFLEKLQANASNLVRVRPVGAPSGDDSAAVLARVESAAVNADIGVALAELDAVPPLLAERDCVGEPEPERVAAPREALADCDTDGDGCENRQYCQRSPVSTALHTELRDASSKRSVWPADRSAQQ